MKIEKIKRRRFISSVALRTALIALFVLSSLSLTSGAAGSTCVTSSGVTIQAEICNTWNGLLPIAVIAVLLSFTVAAIIFMVGTATKNERIKNFGVGELYEAATTAIIVGFALVIAGLLVQTIPLTFLGIIQSSGSSTAPISDPYVLSTDAMLYTINTIQIEYDCVVSGNPSIPNGPPAPPPPLGPAGQPNGAKCPFTPGDKPILNPINPASQWLLSTGSTNFAFVSAYTTWQLTLPFVGPGGYTGTLFSGLSQVGQLAIDDVQATWRNILFASIQLPETVVASYLLDGLFVLWGLFYLIMFFSFIGPVFICLGIIFRAFLPTRSLGGMLIAMGIGFFVVAPTLFALLYSPSINPFPSTLNYNVCGGSIGFPTLICEGFTGISNALSQLWLELVFYPILVTALTYTFVTQVANFIGAAPNMGKLRTGFI